MTTGPVFGQDPSAAAWVGARLTGRWGHVTGTVPAGFDGYARILHPVEDGEGPSLSWSEVAREAGTQIHPMAQWNRVARQQPGQRSRWQDAGPEEGNLSAVTLQRLVDALRSHTPTPEDCWFCLWVGYGWIHGSPSVQLLTFDGDSDGDVSQVDVPPAFPDGWLDDSLHVRHPGREYLLGRGPLAAALDVGHHVHDGWFISQSPNLFWPADRAWCVATEIDFDSTLVGGSHQLIDALLADPDLEVWRVQPDDSLQDNADQLN